MLVGFLYVDSSLVHLPSPPLSHLEVRCKHDPEAPRPEHLDALKDRVQAREGEEEHPPAARQGGGVRGVHEQQLLAHSAVVQDLEEAGERGCGELWGVRREGGVERGGRASLAGGVGEIMKPLLTLTSYRTLERR